MSNTQENLKAAFAGESQASHKYQAFARKAEQEGLPQIAKLFRAAAHAETIHAINHLKALDAVESTLDNLKTAIHGEHYEVVDMYPPFVAEAETNDEKRALTSFRWALEVEKVHEELYQAAHDLLEGGVHEEDGYDYYVCPFCGYTHARSAPEKCPVCGTVGQKFEKVG